MSCGVYEIWIGPYFYQGSSQDCEVRCQKHLLSLKKGKANRKMQNAWNKHQTFEWQQLIECDDRKVAYDYEQDYIDANWEDKHYLNLSDIATAPPARKGIKRKPHTKEAKSLMSKNKKGKKLGPQSDEHKLKRADARKGKKQSEETKEKIRQTLLNRNKGLN